MILPKKNKDPYKKHYSAAATAVICFLLYLILSFASVSDPDKMQIEMSEMRELNITRYEALIEEPEPELVEEEVEETPEVEAESPAEPEAPIVKRVDLDEIMPQGLRTDLSTTQQNQQHELTRTQTQSTSESRSLRMDEAELDRSGLRTLAGNEPSITRNRTNLRGGNDDSNGSGLQLAERGARTEARGELGGEGAGSLLGGAQGRELAYEGTQVGLRDLEEFGDNYSDVEPIIHDLIRWMEENTAEIPVPVRRVMEDGRWDPSYLTSRVPFYVGDRQFNLYIMVKPDILEVHIFLVENYEEAIYLIDRGFAGRSNYLRVGNVDYHDNSLTQVDSQMREAREDDTNAFYEIFLSWWNSVES